VVARPGADNGVAAPRRVPAAPDDRIEVRVNTKIAALNGDDVLELLGIDISPARLKCAMLSLDTLQQALGDLDVAKAKAEAEA